MPSPEWIRKVSEDLIDWMKFIPDEYSITQLTIPGTHDSTSTKQAVGDDIRATWAITQGVSIDSQLQMGVRYVDLRVGKDYRMCHGPVTLADNLDHVLSQIKDFLERHPSETILVAIKPDQDDCPSDLDYQIKRKWIDYHWYFEIKWPALRDVRGKAILLRRYGPWNEENLGINLVGMYNEKEHSGAASWDQQDSGTDSGLEYDHRWARSFSQLNRALRSEFDDQKMHFTVLADNVKFDLKNLNALEKTPWRYAAYLTPMLLRMLGNQDYTIKPFNQRFGVIIVDYMNPITCWKIISKNWEQRVHIDKMSFTYRTSVDPIEQFPNGTKFFLQGDGNFVIKDKRGEVRWATDTGGQPNSDLINLQCRDDNNFVLYNNLDEKWKSDTAGKTDVTLRFMSGPPYLMIDTWGSEGQIYWSTLGNLNGGLSAVDAVLLKG